MTWKKRCDSAELEEMFLRAQDCDISPAQAKPMSTGERVVYAGTGKRALQTVKQLMPDASPVEEKLLDETPVRACKDTGKKLPLWYWNFMAGWQRFWNNSRQPESRTQMIARAEELIDKLEAQGQDCILVSYPVFLGVLLGRFRARGYCVTRSGTFGIEPLERIRITKWDMHCGGCAHRCLLTNPGCGVGREAAMRRGIKA